MKPDMRPFVVGTLTSVLVMLEASKIAVGLPSISAEVALDTAAAQLLTGGFLLATAVALVPAGALGDRWGRHWCYGLGIGLYLVGSLVAGLASTPEVLVAGRILQGLGTGVILPQTIGLIAEMPVKSRPRAHALYGMALGLANILGPIAGGLLLTVASGEGGWRILFLANIPFAAVLAWLTWTRMPRTASAREHTGFDLVAALLIVMSLGSLFLPVLWVDRGGSHSASAWMALVPAAIGILALIAWENRRVRARRTVLLDPRLLSVRTFRRGLVVGFGWYVATPASILLLALYVQGALGMSPLAAGLLGIPFAAGAALGSRLAMRFAGRGDARIVLIGLSLNLLGLTVCALVLVVPEAVAVVGGAYLIAGIGGGLASTANQVATFVAIPRGREGMAGGVQQLTQRVANALGLTVAVAIASSAGGTAAGLTEGAYVAGLVAPVGALAVAVGIALVDASRVCWARSNEEREFHPHDEFHGRRRHHRRRNDKHGVSRQPHSTA